MFRKWENLPLRPRYRIFSSAAVLLWCVVQQGALPPVSSSDVRSRVTGVHLARPMNEGACVPARPFRQKSNEPKALISRMRTLMLRRSLTASIWHFRLNLPLHRLRISNEQRTPLLSYPSSKVHALYREKIPTHTYTNVKFISDKRSWGKKEKQHRLEHMR